MKVSLTLKPGEGEEKLFFVAAKKAGVKGKYYSRIVKKSLDARDKGDIKWVYTVEISDTPFPKEQELPRAKKKGRVLVVGAGPAGLFCALYLARAGLSVTLCERGSAVEERAKDVENFLKTRALNPESNVQFGEGGAGTFSDGKLNTQVNNPLIKRVLGDFVSFGAPQEVEYSNKPHIGSDRLPGVVRAMREEIIRLGGTVRFNHKFQSLKTENGRAVGDFDEIVLAVGHSARDVFEMLLRAGVKMECKNFAVGLRVEHLQKAINFAQYGGAEGLPPADYKLVSHASDRAVFTFCMCPGGYVIPAASEEGGVVTNGYSNYLRDGLNANSAVIAQVLTSDFASDSPLAGVEFQRKLERQAFLTGGGNYCAPACKVADFVRNRGFSDLKCETSPTYALGVKAANLRKILPAGVAEALALGIADMGKKIRGFGSAGILTGVESRTSSPVRILRGENMASVSVENLYPCGEGAGYAGGITSAAADGIRVAMAITQKYR